MTRYYIRFYWRNGMTKVSYWIAGCYSVEAGYDWFAQWQKERGNQRGYAVEVVRRRE